MHLYLDEEKKNPKHIGHKYCVMEKYDGWYMYIDCIDGQWQEIRSRAGRVIPSMANYTKQFQNINGKYRPKRNVRLIFEGVIPNEKGYPTEFKTANGWFNRKAPIHKPVLLMCHDLLTFDYLDTPFKTRYETLQYLIGIYRQNKLVDGLGAVPILYTSNRPSEWYGTYENIIKQYDNQGEGVILKRLDAPYSSDKRNADLLKIKCEKTFELRVVGKVEGEGKYKGTLGKLIVEDANGIRNGISGMSDEQRHLWWKDFEGTIEGAIVEVQCMKVLSNKSLREGRFKAVRHDKTEIDTL